MVKEIKYRGIKMEYLTIFISILTTFVATYIAASLAYKNSKKVRYYDEKKKIYYDLAEILPIVDEFKCQSDYLDGSEGNGKAANKMKIMKMQLDEVKHCFIKLEKEGKERAKIEEVRVEISNLEYKIEKHEKYLKEFKDLFNRIERFEQRGKKNLLRIFASRKVWNSYISFTVALSNEYNTSIGVKAEDIKYHINKLIGYMREDLR